MSCHQDYTSKLRNHYEPLIQKYGVSHKSVDWGSEAGQDIRLKILLEIAPIQGASILDIGCGMGRLVDHLKKQYYKGSYQGTDLLEKMITGAQSNHPDWSFTLCDALSQESELRADYVFGSGLFTFSNEKQMKATITAMFERCNKGTGINSLSSWAQECEPGEFQADPLRILDFCRSLTPKITLRHDYMNHDFTIYLHK